MRKTHLFTGLFAVAAALAVGGNAKADTVTWAIWSNTYTAGATSGSATANMGGIDVTYTGEVESVVANYPSWKPTSTYTNGTSVTNAPPQSGGIVQLYGGSYGPGTDTITFSTPVANPVMAIWSLGADQNNNPDPAYFDFTASEPFVIIAGGPSNEYNGSSITKSGSTVSGVEGNGTIEFIGTYSSITFTTPTFEDWYGFTVGYSSVAVPLPASALSGSVVLAGVALANQLRRRRQV